MRNLRWKLVIFEFKLNYIIHVSDFSKKRKETIFVSLYFK